MIATRSAGLQSVLGFPAAEQMNDPTNDAWRQPYSSNPTSYTVGQWSSTQGLPMGGMHNTDLSMFQGETYHGAFDRSTEPLLSPHLNYGNDGDWASDYDMGSPAGANFPGQAPDAYPLVPSSNQNQNLTVPVGNSLRASSSHSPTSSFGSASPQQQFAVLNNSNRPPIARSHTAPEGIPQKKALVTSNPPPGKQAGSDGDDEEFLPGEDVKQRGRKRQRIPHTAVERRYREALNAGIKSLQVAVATSKNATGGAKTVNDDKPSKSTILHSAIEQIETLTAENASLHNENRALRARLEDLEKWYTGPQAGHFGKY